MFKNRKDAGLSLSNALEEYKNSNAVILALPRGGVEVGFYVSKTLQLPLDILIVRKIGSPHNPELAVGALAEPDGCYLDHALIDRLDLTRKDINSVIRQEKEELKRRILQYRRGRPFIHLYNRTVILVDDGIATGSTMLAALESIKKLHPKKIIIASPVCSVESIKLLKREADEIISLVSPDFLSAIGQYYYDFRQLSDDEVIFFLKHVND